MQAKISIYSLICTIHNISGVRAAQPAHAHAVPLSMRKARVSGATHSPDHGTHTSGGGFTVYARAV